MMPDAEIEAELTRLITKKQYVAANGNSNLAARERQVSQVNEQIGQFVCENWPSITAAMNTDKLDKARAALKAQEDAECINANCEQCANSDLDCSTCAECSKHMGRAIDLRRDALAMIGETNDQAI